jgi:hypothetical protein
MPLMSSYLDPLAWILMQIEKFTSSRENTQTLINFHINNEKSLQWDN